MLEENLRIQKARRVAEQMLRLGGLPCHSWPLGLRPYELVRWQNDSRQQRRRRAQKGGF